MIVYKFGGASVKSASGLKKIAEIVKNTNDDLIIVISAMGKMTNAFEILVEKYFHKSDEVYMLLNNIIKYHSKICAELFVKEELELIAIKCEHIANELMHILKSHPSPDFNFEYDRIVSYGELYSTIIVSEYLNGKGIYNKWIDIRKVLITDDSYREAKVNYKATEALIKKVFRNNKKSIRDIYITQGFIGADKNGNTTTLGREGSDYTGALLANLLDAERLLVWKDVPGIMNADPAWYEGAYKIEEMNYKEAIELAFYGAKVIHPKTIKPLQNKNIPLEVRSFIDSNQEGTFISAKEIYIKHPIYILKTNQILISISNRDFSFILEDSLSVIFKLFALYKVKINLMQNSAVSFTVCCDYSQTKHDELIDGLKTNFNVLYNTEVNLLTIRHYIHMQNEDVLKDKVVLMEQRSRNTVQYVFGKR